MAASHLVKRMILVYLDGSIGGDVQSDSEWANTPAANFESYVIDVMRSVDSCFSTIANRRDRVVAGFSAGAYGAVNIALPNLADFGGAQAWSGYYLHGRIGGFDRSSRTSPDFNSPLSFVRTLTRATSKRDPLRAFLFVGSDDGLLPQQAPMARALRALGAHVQPAVYAGGHDWDV